jgi:hypothetical protein
MNPEYSKVRFQTETNPKDLPDEFFIITSYNPVDQKLPETENRKRNLSLQKKILQAGYICFSIIGASPDFTHQEPSFISNAPKELAFLWAKEFNQRAIFRVSKDELTILGCQNKDESIALGSFRARLATRNDID